MSPVDINSRGMNPCRPFILRPVATLLLAIGLLIFGIAAWAMLPVAALPQVEYPVMNVLANLPGASAQTMATSIAAPLERQFAYLNGIVSINSTSNPSRRHMSAHRWLN